MDTINLAGKASGAPAPTFTLNPLDDDLPTDDLVLTTRRGLCRVAMVAAEAGARFQREAIPIDPMGWMLAPRDVFRGRSGLDACLELDGFKRGVMLHALSLGLDADADELDMVLSDDGVPRTSRARPSIGPGSRRRRARIGPQLFTATVTHTSPSVLIQAFHASFAHEASDILHRLIGRFGPDVAAEAEIRLGFQPAMPLVIALVSEPVGQLIRDVESGAALVRAADFSVDVEQRISI